MIARDPSAPDLGVRDAGFGALSLASVASILVVQFAWIVIFDETGLDEAAPDAVFTLVLPAVTVAVVPALAAGYLYSRRVALVAAAAAIVAGGAAALYTVRLFAVCGGPGC